ncbi:uncharacterized protein LOC120532174 isoform X2 [Polypterus senegalus]|uniref:uncharacterized protein LOC120532174 isoform X2 n=1 Tax=Polypterus senegalus TaxID=55291 RepID=UPI001965C6E2|nr:uncharacterized protein LOC120532174 isoform X2 [Polypterus senegalus]
MMKKQQSCKQMKSHIGSMKPPESTYSAKKSTLTINNHKVLDNKNTSESEVIPDSRGIQSPPLKQPAWELNKDSLEEDQAEEEQIEQKIPVLDEKNESPLKESSQQQELCEESKINKAFPQLQLTGLPHHETDPRLHSEHLELETVTVKNPKTSSLQVERDRTLHISDQNVLGVLSAFTDNYIPGFGEEIPNRNLGYQRQTSVNGVTKCPVQPCRSRMDPLFTAPRMLLYSTDLSPVVTLRDSRGTRHTSWTEPENQDSKNSLIKALIPVQARVCGRLTHGNKYIN